MTSPHLKSLRAAQLHMTGLENAWNAAKKSNQEVNSVAEIPVPQSLLDAVSQASDLEVAADAWEAVNYYNEAYLFAFQRVEDEAFKAMVNFEIRATLAGYCVSSVVQVYRSCTYHTRTNASV